VSRFRPTRMHVLLGLAVVLMATIPVLVPLAFTGGASTEPTDVVRLAAGPAGGPSVPAGPAVPATSAPAQAAPAAAGSLRSTTPTPSATPTSAAPTSDPAPPPAATTATTDATTTAPTPDPTTSDPTARARVFAALPNLVVTAVSWDPGGPTDGQPVVFSATVRNDGGAATPDTTLGVAFSVDGTEVTWSDSDSTPLAPGEERTYTADNGITANTWTATPGPHTLQAWADSPDRIPELTEADNTLTTQLTIP
jgi:CARDB